MNAEYSQFDRCTSIGTIPIYSRSTKMRRSYTVRMFDLLSPFYDALVPWICRLRVNRSDVERISTEIFGQLDCKPEHRLLDVGIGTGINLVRLQPRPRSVVGVDASIGMLRRCARRLRKLGIQGELFCHSAEKLYFADDEFDRILCVNVLMYVPSYHHVINEMLRVLKPTGKLLLTVASCWLTRQDKPLFQGLDQEFLVTETEPMQGLITVIAVRPREQRCPCGKGE